MKQVLFIRPASDATGIINWCTSDSEGTGELASVAELVTLAAHPLAQHVCLLLPAGDMVFRHFSLAQKRAGRATPFSWLAEETLLGEVDELHWTVLKKQGREVDAVGVQRERLRRWLTQCSEAGLGVIQALPDAWLLPETPQGCTLAEMKGQYWWRHSHGGAGECDAVLLSLLLAKLGGESLLSFGPPPSGVNATQCEAWQHPILLLVPQWRSCRINVLHGEFARRVASPQARRRYCQGLAAATALLAATLLAPPALTAWQLVRQENRLQEEMVQLARHHFPSMKQMTNLKYHFGQNAKRDKKGLFLQLEDLDQLRQGTPAVQVNSVEFEGREQRLTLIVESAEQSALQAFVAQSQPVFDFTLQPISSESPYTAIVTGVLK